MRPGALQLVVTLLASSADARKVKKKSTATGLARLADFHHEFWDTSNAITELKAYIDREHDAVLAVRDKDNHSALNIAAYKGNIDGVRALIAAGADVNNADVNFHRPLHHAVLSSSPRADVVKALLAAGARRTEKDRFGKTALDYARNPRHPPKAANRSSKPILAMLLEQ